MKKVCFSTMINAPKEKVWHVLWDEQTYPTWAGVFSAGSRAESDWQEGSKVVFSSAGGSGMYGRIAKSTPHEYISFQHLGEVKDGQELAFAQHHPDWAGATENYTLRQIGNTTELTVEMDVTEEHQTYFAQTFPLALEKVKELAEA
ncbi:SRPBCC family protein [Hymenobacter chitinivorans]|uniref:Activator of Hsp90 ATPase-like protein n=1 Tax=Hymenobacter chitinivorans DSM 11115 TaxID=1121954 RepID=A0A2M9BM82_9BACT|nr:SRPBCC domain-containing protein [Hymenobacter chitinivorans]PJJ59064.1 activator of Hsp90 ATPase-like protein [Hymenobacter chitinivorans DSM 11115]